MARTASVVLAVVAVVGALAWVPLPGLADGHAETQTMNGSTAPGEAFAGAVGVQQADLSGEVDARAFGLRLSNATTNESKAAVLAAEYESLSERQTALERRRAELMAARENGTISEGRYRAEMAQLHARSRAVQRLANRSADTVERLPAAALTAKGVDAAAVRQLRSNAANLTGPETAAIARGIAGRSAGERGGPPGLGAGERSGPDRGGPDRSGNTTGGGPDRGGNATEGGPGRGNGAPGSGPPGQ